MLCWQNIVGLYLNLISLFLKKRSQLYSLWAVQKKAHRGGPSRVPAANKFFLQKCPPKKFSLFCTASLEIIGVNIKD